MQERRYTSGDPDAFALGQLVLVSDHREELVLDRFPVFLEVQPPFQVHGIGFRVMPWGSSEAGNVRCGDLQRAR